MTVTEPTFIHTACSECKTDVALETTGYSPLSAAIAAQTAAGWLCDQCYDDIEKRERSEREREIAARAHAEHRRAIQRSRVPRLPDDFELPEGPAAAAALAWAQRRTLRLTLFGPVGTGKSTLAQWAFHERLRPRVLDGKLRTRPGAWRSMAGYMAQLGAGFGTPAKDDAVWLAGGGIVLALDDLDKTTPTEYAAQQVYTLINAAYESRAPLIVTTNANPAELASRWPGGWGDAIVSRLCEGDVVELDGIDRRMAAREAA